MRSLLHLEMPRDTPPESMPLPNYLPDIDTSETPDIAIRGKYGVKVLPIFQSANDS
jgi:hypothetical protein